MNGDLTFVIIDDNPIDILIHSMHLKHEFGDPAIINFNNAEKGLTYIKEIHSNEANRKTILLLDLDMPIMNGQQFLNHFEKLDQGIKDRVKIFVVSSSVNELEKKTISANPCVRIFISKPLTRANIADIINDIN
jgi:response regulator RpfG family c-di-GMP phosphodiesterase